MNPSSLHRTLLTADSSKCGNAETCPAERGRSRSRFRAWSPSVASALSAVCLWATGTYGYGAPPADGTAPKAVKTVRLLTIGNSFSANATRFLGDLAKAGGNVLIHRPIVVGGAPLDLHAGKMQANERNPQDPAGLYANGRGLKQELQADKWDFVTIQQASIKSHDLSTYQPFANQLRDYVHLHAPQAELLLHETWEYRADDPRFTKPSGKEGEPKTQEEMYRNLNAAYATVAEQLGVRRIPVGDAFHLADSDAQWGYHAVLPFDPKSVKSPALPDQTHSLHMGWQWKAPKDGPPTLGMDGHHANVAGQYLGACVWYEVLFGESAVGSKFVPPDLDPAYAHFLQETAHKAVAGAQTKKAQPLPKAAWASPENHFDLAVFATARTQVDALPFLVSP